MRRRFLQCPVLLLAALGSAACATRSGSVPAPETRRVIVETGAGTQLIMLTHEPGVASQLVSAPADRVFAALVAVFQELQLPITAVDTATHVVATQRTIVKQIGGQFVDRFFECAGGYENYASTGRVTVDVHSQAVPVDSAHAQVRTTITAVAAPRTGGQPVPCTTNAQLYRLIHARLGQSLRAATP